MEISLYNMFQKPVEQIYSQLWLIFQPILFGLIGTEILISELDKSTVILGLCVLLCGLIVSVIDLDKYDAIDNGSFLSGQYILIKLKEKEKY
jgi:NhaP-type Na+/H+ or K+/H+ antiporter